MVKLHLSTSMWRRLLQIRAQLTCLSATGARRNCICGTLEYFGLDGQERVDNRKSKDKSIGFELIVKGSWIKRQHIEWNIQSGRWRFILTHPTLHSIRHSNTTQYIEKRRASQDNDDWKRLQLINQHSNHYQWLFATLWLWFNSGHVFILPRLMVTDL